MTKTYKTYLAGDIMTPGARLQRQREVDETKARNLPLDIYSPVLNKSINDKTGVSTVDNAKLAEAITEADIDRMWDSDIVVMEIAPNAIGTICELGCIFGWKYFAEQYDKCETEEEKDAIVQKMKDKMLAVHYDDLRNTDIPEFGWRRSHSINQLLYGMVLYSAYTGDIDTFEDVLCAVDAFVKAESPEDKEELKQQYRTKKAEKEKLSTKLYTEFEKIRQKFKKEA